MNVCVCVCSNRCAVIFEMREGQTMDFLCEMEGRYVTVILPGENKYLTLCEVEVYSSTKKEVPSQPSIPPPTEGSNT